MRYGIESVINVLELSENEFVLELERKNASGKENQ